MERLYDTAVIIKKLNKKTDPYICGIAHSAKLVLQTLEISVISEKDLDKMNDRTLFIAIGGDGTMLYTARIAVGVGGAVIGINLGNLGFLTEFQPQYIEDTLKRAVFNDRIKIEERTLLHVDTYTGEDIGQQHYAFNDITFSDLYSDYTLQYDMHLGHGMTKANYAGRHKANAAIVSTPTGSTAYALNVGGSILDPGLDVIQILPVAALTMTSRPIMVSGETRIKINFKMDPDRILAIKCDGQIVRECEPGAEVRLLVTRLEKRVRVIHDEKWNFYSTLTDKLGWNQELY